MGNPFIWTPITRNGWSIFITLRDFEAEGAFQMKIPNDFIKISSEGRCDKHTVCEKVQLDISSWRVLLLFLFIGTSPQ